MINREKFNKSKEHSENMAKRAEAVSGLRFPILRLYDTKLVAAKFITPFSWMIDFHEHEFDEDTPAKNLCEAVHYDRECRFCKQEKPIEVEGKIRNVKNRARRQFSALIYIPAFDGATEEIGGEGEYKGRLKKIESVQIIRIPAGENNRNYLALQDAESKGKFSSRVWKFEYVKGDRNGAFQKPELIAAEDLQSEWGIAEGCPISAEAKESVKGIDEAKFIAHVLHTFQNADYEYFELAKPEKYDWKNLLVPIVGETKPAAQTNKPAQKPAIAKDTSSESLGALLDSPPTTSAPPKQEVKKEEVKAEAPPEKVEENKTLDAIQDSEPGGIDLDNVSLEALLA